MIYLIYILPSLAQRSPPDDLDQWQWWQFLDCCYYGLLCLSLIQKAFLAIPDSGTPRKRDILNRWFFQKAIYYCKQQSLKASRQGNEQQQNIDFHKEIQRKPCLEKIKRNRMKSVWLDWPGRFSSEWGITVLVLGGSDSSSSLPHLPYSAHGLTAFCIRAMEGDLCSL